MKHAMKLYESPFKRIKSGRKKIELRLYDEKRQKVSIGDTITFTKLPDKDESIDTTVIGLLQYASFKELVEHTPMSYFGYPEDYNKDAFVQSMYSIYLPELEREHGVLGIVLKR